MTIFGDATNNLVMLGSARQGRVSKHARRLCNIELRAFPPGHGGYGRARL